MGIDKRSNINQYRGNLNGLKSVVGAFYMPIYISMCSVSHSLVRFSDTWLKYVNTSDCKRERKHSQTDVVIDMVHVSELIPGWFVLFFLLYAQRFTFSLGVNSFFVEVLQILHLGEKFKS